jgi:type VI secretion system secreted protein Hcp
MAVDAFLKLGDLKGESRVIDFEEHIQILSWSWGMSQGGTTHTGSGGGAGKVNVQDLAFTHYVDTASPNIIKACCSGMHFPEATLTLRKAGTEPLDYLIIKLSDIIVTSVSTGGSQGEEMNTENFTLNFAGFEYSYQPQDNKGAKAGGSIDYEANIAEGKFD